MSGGVTYLQELFESDDWAHLSTAGHRFNPAQEHF